MVFTDEIGAGGSGGIEVEAPSGSSFPVATEDEASYFRDKAQRYQSDNHLVNVADLTELDRLLILELLAWRWGQWLSREQDYDGNAIDAETTKRSLNDYSKEIRLTKKALGIDKSTRERERGENFKDYLENLRVRAREFGVMREEQLTKSITLFQELKALVTLHLNCDDEERRENNVELHDLFEWIVTTAIPEFDKIDEYFRQNSQRYWVAKI